MNKHQRIGRWVSGLLLCGAVCGLLVQEVAMGQGGRGPGGGGPGGRRGGPGGGPQRGGFQGGGPQGGVPQKGGPQRGGPQGGGQQGGGFGGGPIAGGGGAGNCQSMMDKVMTMDFNGDGMLTANEVQDPRLQGMMSVADVDANGVVTQDELRNMFMQRLAQQGDFGGGPPGFGGGEFGGEGPGRGPGGFGPGGRGPGGAPPQLGELMPGFIQDELELSEEQRSRLVELQKAVDKKILSILSKEQRVRYKEMQLRGPEGQGGGPAGGRGPDGGPPSDQDAGRPQKESEKGSTAGI